MLLNSSLGTLTSTNCWRCSRSTPSCTSSWVVEQRHALKAARSQWPHSILRTAALRRAGAAKTSILLLLLLLLLHAIIPQQVQQGSPSPAAPLSITPKCCGCSRCSAVPELSLTVSPLAAVGAATAALPGSCSMPPQPHSPSKSSTGAACEVSAATSAPGCGPAAGCTAGCCWSTWSAPSCAFVSAAVACAGCCSRPSNRSNKTLDTAASAAALSSSAAGTAAAPVLLRCKLSLLPSALTAGTVTAVA
ncbi:hypothetical protein COO60DRAFT_8676 [Scenedesmus sp. NREL 46B-D3]|nr:hypothetical protein COO60DRAFT_8676 [Scenedesmus sp. NREL 46B-D3]